MLSFLSHIFSFNEIGCYAHVCNFVPPPSPLSLSWWTWPLINNVTVRSTSWVQVLHCFRLIDKGAAGGLQGAALKELFKTLLGSSSDGSPLRSLWLADATAQFAGCNVNCTDAKVWANLPEIRPDFKITCLHLERSRQIWGKSSEIRLQNLFYATALAFISAAGDKRC